MLVFPNAKLNIGLNITGKRADGYHDIESVFLPIGYSDVLELLPGNAAETSLKMTGLPIDGATTSNLIWKAWQLLAERYNIAPVQLHLHKTIPMGAGLGGGSADGAFALILLNNFFKLGLDDATLESLALELGSDCPFFIRNTPQLVTGRGEVMEPFELDLAGYWLALLSPEIHIGTREAYANVQPGQPSYSLTEALQQPVAEWRNVVENQFERSVFPNHPQLQKLKQQLYKAGALYASMTGSGSSMYGIFKREPMLEDHDLPRHWIGKL